jgi:hypothetical protein
MAAMIQHMTTFFRKAKTMFERLKRVFGVPDDNQTAAGRMARKLQAVDRRPTYLPASRLTELQVDAVGDDGSVWIPWRDDADGEQWYQRVSQDSQQQAAAPEILAFDAGDDVDDANPFDDDESDHDPIEAFRRETAILKSQYERGEIGNLFGDDEYQADFDEN